jgi:outer membrane receptor for ferrienterochelin and colicins
MNNVKRIEVLKELLLLFTVPMPLPGNQHHYRQPKNLITVTSNTKIEERGQFTQGVNVDVNTGKFGSFTSYTRQQSDSWKLNSYDEDGNLTDKLPVNAFYSDVINQKFTYSPTAALSMYAEGGYYDRMTKRPVSAYTTT